MNNIAVVVLFGQGLVRRAQKNAFLVIIYHKMKK